MQPLSKEKAEELIRQAILARQEGYAPYSGFKVGAALLGKKGKIYTGCNVENIAFPATRCAEQTAVLKGVSSGEREFLALAVVADLKGFCGPCGLCRQILSEFAPDMWVVMANITGEYEIQTLQNLLPHSFSRYNVNTDTLHGDNE